ncbi:hypothetical protein KIPB_005433 [Kipferlia bialata]|uniref:D-isomer specific 2-hydroxyacid dehydrogenase NAD-binding domain-containing protein n=1 Tax=Kipferlia bialata TaxID=797122 RepID=A0A9K3GIX1_9EUKA|nr:hypothetical protein KIPB_005433 [Kipferlia bialata]|eukprot:g5433.t1
MYPYPYLSHPQSSTPIGQGVPGQYMQRFIGRLEQQLQDLHFRPSVSMCDTDTCPADTDFVIVWGTFPRFLRSIPPQTCKAIFSFGAGVDHLVSVAHCIPKQRGNDRIPLIRLTDDQRGQKMSEYVLFNVLRYITHAHTYRVQQEEALWSPVSHTYGVRVGFLGYGKLARHCHDAAKAFVPNVAVWTRTSRHPLKIHATLDQFLGDTDVLIVLCPLTPETRHLLNERTLSLLPKGACLINASRGPVVDTEGLKTVMQRGHLSFAALDVFETEPLPPSDSLWGMDNVYITPHCSAITSPMSVARDMAGKMRQICDGDTDVMGVVDMERMY